jgi:hydroxymethylglutaryl-CoA reductase
MSPSAIDVVFGSAPGKIILFGEHAVVFGQPAIASTIDRGIRVAVSRREGQDDGPILRSSSAMLPLRSDGAIPAGAGLGSSAALAVALVRGIHQFYGESIDDGTLIERAFAVEKVFHGNPSGVDHTTIVTGGVVSYTRGDDGAAASVAKVALPRPLSLVIGVAGPHAGTANAVGALRDRARRHPEHYGRIYDAIGALSRAARAHLEKGEYAAVGELMDVNQGYLNALGVSTPAIEALCAIARERGALGAKLSGAGGGGAVIALVDDTAQDGADAITRAFAAAGYAAFATVLPSSTSNASQELP